MPFIKRAKETIAHSIIFLGMGILAIMQMGLTNIPHNLDDKTSISSSSFNGKSYIVQEGESLWEIAGKYTASDDWKKIYEANSKYISSAYMIFPGQSLTIPDSMLRDEKEDDDETLDEEESTPEADTSSISADSTSVANETKVFDPVLKIDGLIIDETISKVGRDFYDVFYSEWDAPKDAFNYTVTVSETPMPNYNTRVTIKVNDTDVYQAHLQPRYAVIEEAAQQGAGRTQWYLQNYETAPISY